MNLKEVNDKVMITIVASIPITILMPKMVRVTFSTGLLYIVHELHFGLQSPMSLMKKSSVQNNMTVVSLAFCIGESNAIDVQYLFNSSPCSPDSSS